MQRELEACLDGRCATATRDFEEEMESKLKIRRTRVSAHFNRRLDQARKRLATMERSEQDRSRGIKLTTLQIAHLQEARDRELNNIDDSGEVTGSMDNVVCGVVQVETA